jgi:ABC-2 type transport system permease protein
VTRLIAAELFKLRKRSMTVVLLSILVGIIVILYLLLLAVSKVNLPNRIADQPGAIQNLLGLPLAIPFALTLLSFFGTVMAVILLASSMGNEYNWRTIRTMLICSESRSKLLWAKLISAGILILAGMIIGVAVGFIMSLITTAIGGYAFSFSFATGGYLWDQFLQFWRIGFVILPYLMIGFLFAIVGRSAMPGIALGIGVLFLEGIITAFMELAGGWIASVPDYLLAANVRAITSLSKLPQSIGSGFGGNNAQTPSTPHAFIVLSVYIVFFVFVAFYLFRKRDVTG